MAELSYLDFDLRLVRADGGYHARGWDGAGREATAEFRNPLESEGMGVSHPPAARVRHARTPQAEPAEPLDLTGIRALAQDVGPTVLYYVAAGETYAFLLPGGGGEPIVRAFDLRWGDLQRRARQLAETLANPNYEDAASDLLRELSSDLLAPLAEHLPTSGPLTLVAHGPLHQIPFEALPGEDGRPLFERLDLTAAPSVSTLAHLRARHREPRGDDGLFALASGEGITLAAAEIRKIAGFFRADQAADFEPTMARYQSYKNLAPRARQLLIASQGTLTPGHNRQTYLEIEPTDGHDHRLTAAEIATIAINAELVTLAACDTGAAEALLSDERLDLTRAFLVAGAASVLATRWKVPEDYRTSRFLVDFYRAYRRGGPDGKGLRKDQALTEARRLSRQRGDPAQI